MRPALICLVLVATGCAPVMQRETTSLNTLRVQEALGGYETARRAADPLNLCVKAKLVAIAYEDAKDNANGAAWRAREREACRTAMAALGVTRGEDAAAPAR